MIIRGEAGDDPNYWWAKQFNNYEFVPKVLNNVVEFGCGPFTNLRIILKGRYAKHIFASDPKEEPSLSFWHLNFRRKEKTTICGIKIVK